MRSTTTHTGSRPATGDVHDTRLLEVIQRASETAELIERVYAGRETRASRLLCISLRSFAREAFGRESDSGAESTIANPSARRPDAAREAIDRRTATHAMPVGSGGMGPMMNLSPAENRAVSWGEDFHGPRPDLGEDEG